MDLSKAKLLAIIPAYNEENSVANVIRDIRREIPEMDVLVINDQSTDATEAVLRKNRINHLTLTNNLGIGGAVQAGLLYALRHQYDYTVQVDGDGQHPAGNIRELLQALVDNRTDIVIGSRYLTSQQRVSSLARRIGGGLLSTWIRLVTGVRVTDPTSGFRALNARAIRFLSQHYPQEYPEPISIIDVLENGLSLLEIPVTMKSRAHGQSSIQGLNTFFYMVKVMFAILIAKFRRGEKACLKLH